MVKRQIGFKSTGNCQPSSWLLAIGPRLSASPESYTRLILFRGKIPEAHQKVVGCIQGLSVVLRAATGVEKTVSLAFI